GLMASSGQSWRAVSWHSGFRGGAHGRRETARVDSPARRCSGRMADRGTRAAASDAGYWFPAGHLARCRHVPRGCLPPGLEGSRLYRGPECRNRIPLIGRSTSSVAGLVYHLVRQQVALIVCNTRSAFTAKAATSTVPIVFVTGGDPVRDGLVA